MPTISVTDNAYLKQVGGNSYYSFALSNANDDVTDWIEFTWPISVQNGNDTPVTNVTVHFITSFTFTVGINDFYFILLQSDYITLNGSEVHFDFSTSFYPAPIQNGNGTDAILLTAGYSYITIQNFSIIITGTPSLQGYLCGPYFGAGTSGPITVSNCTTSGDVTNAIGSCGLFGEYAFLESTGSITIEHCTNNCNVLAIFNTSSGGIFGGGAFENSTGTISIDHCTNNGVMTPPNSGGIFALSAF